MQVRRRRGRLTATNLGREVPQRAARRRVAGDVRGETHVDERGAAVLGAVAGRPRSADEHVRELHVPVANPERVQLVERATDAVGDDERELATVDAARAHRRPELVAGSPRRRDVLRARAEPRDAFGDATRVEQGGSPAATEARDEGGLVAQPRVLRERNLEGCNDPVGALCPMHCGRRSAAGRRKGPPGPRLACLAAGRGGGVGRGISGESGGPLRCQLW